MWSDSINSVVTRMRNYCIFVVCLRSVLSSSALSRINTNCITLQLLARVLCFLQNKIHCVPLEKLGDVVKKRFDAGEI